MTEIERLDEVDILEVWPGEATDFTPWLVDEGGLDILGERLRLKFGSARREVKAGPFKADVVCYEVSNPDLTVGVVIENQLKIFDHSHLGQAQVYTLEFKAGICISIAKDFRPQHLAVVEELNSKPGREVDYYCVTVKAVRIGESPPAALFDVAIGPDHRIPSNLRTSQHEVNDAQAVQTPVRRIAAPTNSTQEFLEALRGRLLAVRYRRKAIQGQPYTYLRFNLGPGPARFSIEREDAEQSTRIRLYMRDRAMQHKGWYRQLQTDKIAIDAELGEPADWTSTDRRSAIDVSLPSSIREASDRDKEIEWCVRMLLRYEDVFVDRLKTLRAGMSIVPGDHPVRPFSDAA